MRVLRPPYPRVPWRNGLGSTVELASDAPAPGGPWTWRLSVADVPARAPFSSFPGVDRHILLHPACRGPEHGLRLLGPGLDAEVPRAGRALGFAGEAPVEGVPRGAGLRDVNLMLRRERWRGTFELVEVAAAPLALEGEVVLVHAVEGALEATAGARVEPLDGVEETLVARGPLTLRPRGGPAVVLVAALAMTGGSR